MKVKELIKILSEVKDPEREVTISCQNLSTENRYIEFPILHISKGDPEKITLVGYDKK